MFFTLGRLKDTSIIMKIQFLFLISFVLAFPLDEIKLNDIPSEEEGASVARTLVSRESLVNVNTIKTIKNSDGKITYLPVSTMEYYADCDEDGDPYWLVIDVSGANQNILKGSTFSFSIRDGDHPNYDEVAENYPGKLEGSPAGSPRVQLTGKLQKIWFPNPFDQKKFDLEKCFLQRHPDAAMWLPDNVLSPHKSHWVKFLVDEIYLVGGFGDRAYIGEINQEIYHSAEIIPPKDNNEEGR
ncbi:unnamed protein product [Candida verbasci]|uniref:CREG-like beta-barrel domain-containing protein n=1 Tax=Candida verbasci TaxID=1227364 RepID=A0A9W4XEW8_9ASCO|nr:unnamed protein product [Candida verbasci]